MTDDDYPDHREIVALRGLVEKNRDNLDKHRALNEVQHQDIGDNLENNFHLLDGKVGQVLEVVRGVSKQSERSSTWVYACRAAFATFVAFVVASLSWAATKIVENEQAQTNDAAKGFQIANDLRHDVNTNAQNIEGLRGLHRLPHESDRVSPGKE